MSNLMDDVVGDIKEARLKLVSLTATRKLLLDMPVELRELEGFLYPIQDYDGEVTLPITVHGGEETLKLLQRIGFIGFKRSNGGYSTEWQATGGKAIINGITITATVHRVDQPAKCHLEEYSEIITKFKVVCEDDSVDGVVVR
ncbi:hypothetical protein LCGC14_2530590 [marine sediment metagenome]|uniref:Uncharacterized protein n=1 Tax=marine sediment metagenome TaxID=412755 RepID=A0A0F9ATN2_9ZZZZ